MRGVIILGIQDSVKDVLHGRCHVNMFHRSVLKKENVHFYDKRERKTYTHTHTQYAGTTVIIFKNAGDLIL